MAMIDPKTWGYIKVLGGLGALYIAYLNRPLGLNIPGAIAILAILVVIGGLNYAGKK
jgi:hypothetical protein